MKTKYSIRQWTKNDLPDIKLIARETAWFGEPMELGYGKDEELVALLRVMPYLQHSPDWCWVGILNDQVVGYVLGTPDSKIHHQWIVNHFPKTLIKKIAIGEIKPKIEDYKLLLRQVLNGGGSSQNSLFLKNYPAHLHINLLPSARGIGLGKDLLKTFINKLITRGVDGLHLGTSNRNVGADQFFRKNGFQLKIKRPYKIYPGLGGGECETLIYGMTFKNRKDHEFPELSPPLPYGECQNLGVRHEEFRTLIPGPGLPLDIPMKDSINNCDLVLHENYYYLSYRTAKTHFASGGADLVIIKSKDYTTWEKVAVYNKKGFDFREPRFLSFKGKLLFYFFSSTDQPTNFDPVGSSIVDLSENKWNPLGEFLPEGWVPWRIRTIGSEVYCSAYWAKDFHKTAAKNTKVQLFKSKDGINFYSISEFPQMKVQGACETDFTVLNDGTMIGAVRNEVFGGHIFSSKPEGEISYSTWNWTNTDERLDSPLVFQSKGRVFLVCRRQPTGKLRGGSFESIPEPFATGAAWLKYSFQPKRTALYEIDPKSLSLNFLFDLPSKGDTAFAALATAGNDSFHLINYSCPLDDWDKPWIVGQLEKTIITYAKLTID